MKGIMVPLLMVMMTGMVVGQQQDSSRTANFAPIAGPSADDSQLAPFELSVSDADLLGIKKNGSVLRSRIAPRDPSTGQPLPLNVISGITLVHKDNLNRDLPLQKIQGQDAGNGVIRFGLDDFDLMKLQNNIKLGFDFDNQSRGQFDLVEFYYKTLNSGPTPDDNTSSHASFGTGSSPLAFGQPQTTPIPMLPPPGPEALPGGIAFEGPVMPSRNTAFAQNQSPSGWAPDAQAQTNPAFSSQYQIPSANGWSIPSSTANRFAPLLTSEQKLAQQQALLQQKNQQFQNLLADQQRALAQKEAELVQRKQEFDNQQYAEWLRTRTQADAPSVSRPTGIVSGTDFRPSGPVIVPERFASNDPNLNGSGYQPPIRQSNPFPNRGIKDLAMQVPGVNQSLIGNNRLATQDKRTEHFVYFMLLCSLGLNVYLAWISRGFYVRYNELADELRDTFTATM